LLLRGQSVLASIEVAKVLDANPVPVRPLYTGGDGIDASADGYTAVGEGSQVLGNF